MQSLKNEQTLEQFFEPLYMDHKADGLFICLHDWIFYIWRLETY